MRTLHAKIRGEANSLLVDREIGSGRTEGPQFVQKSAFEDSKGGGARKTTALSRAWRRTANWLGNLTKLDTAVQLGVTRAKIRRRKHPSPPKITSTVQQLEGFAAFEAWQGMITNQMLQEVQWVIPLRKVAMQQAEREEKAAQEASLQKWIKWIHDGPAA